jgi:DNA invertase Pin-like site-specific DNA recombinase
MLLFIVGQPMMQSHQEDMGWIFKKTTKIKKYNVLCVFKSVCEGKNLNRGCLNEMIDFIKLQNGNIHKVICQTYDRIGRNMISNIQFEEKLKSFGCEIEVANFNN